MSLFSSIQSSANALRVNQLGLQIVSNNIANANTPGYIRQELVQAPGLGYRYGDMIIGQGVKAVGVVQKLDNFVLQRMREVQSQLSYSQGLQDANERLESVISELSEYDLSTAMSNFSNAMQELSNQPGSASIRSLVVQRGTELAGGIRQLSSRVTEIASTGNGQINNVANDINRLISSIANLNRRIVEAEGGSISASSAVGLRDERIKQLDELATLVDIQAIEQANGSVTVIVGGDYLVSDGLFRPVKAVNVDGQQKGGVELRIADTDGLLRVSGGTLRGLYDARDSIAGGFLAGLDQLANDVIRQVNLVHSQGQGSRALTSAIGDPVVRDLDVPIEMAGRNLDINNGSFRIHLRDSSTNEEKTYDIIVRSLGDNQDTTFRQIINQLDGINGLQASVSNDGRLQIQSQSQAINFYFSEDSSGLLAAAGINTFFSGSSSSTIQVREDIIRDPSRIAISLDGPGNGTGNAIRLAESFEVSQMFGSDNRSLRQQYESLIASTTQGITAQQTITDGLRNFYQTLEAKHLGVSGVSLDEEGIKMLLFQRAFQASSRVISVANELLQTLVSIV